METPLLGDGKGNYRVKLVGNSGSGKSTVGRNLAVTLGIPYISLDTLFWKPGWEQSSDDEFKLKLEEACRGKESWVIDGNYNSRGGNITTEQSTDIIWLDTPLALTLPRILWRTALRLLRIRAPCSPGCTERFSEVFFSKDSIVWWCLTQHKPIRKREAAMLAEIGINKGGKMRRIGGWGRELREWWQAIEDMASK